jgi:MFS family permease
LGSFALAFQVLGSIITNHATWRRRLWIGIALAHRAMFICILVAPMLFLDTRLRILWIVVALFLHDSLAQTSVPMWLSWMADLVPKERLGRQWAARQKFITGLNMVAMVVIAAVFWYFEKAGMVVKGFIVTGSFGVLLGLTDVLLFFRVPEVPNERVTGVRLRDALAQPLRDNEFRPFLLFMSFFQFAVFTASPFFGLYMFEFLHFSVFTVQMLGTAAALGVVLSSTFWGLLCDTYGFRPVLRILTACKTLTPVAYIIAPRVASISIPFLCLAMFFDGLMNAGMMLSTQGILLKSTPRRNRSMYIAASNFIAVGLVAGIAPVVSGRLIDFLNARVEWHMGIYLFTGYHLIFLSSSALRAVAFFSSAHIREIANVPVPTVLAQVFTRNSMRVARLVHQLGEGPKETQRVRAAFLLGALRHPMAVRQLMQALQDPSHAVQEAAIDALGAIGGAEATESLITAMMSQGNGMRPRAARALGRIRSTEALKALLRNFKSRDTEVLKETVDALAQIGNDAAILPMISLFHDTEDQDLQEHIAAALSKLAETDTIEEVVGLLRERRPPYQRTIR